MVQTDLLPYLAVLPSASYGLLTLWCAGQVLGQRTVAPVAGEHLPVSILKPVKGLDQDSYTNFASFCCQQYQAPVQIVFTVASAEDPVIPEIRRLISDFPDQDISLIIETTPHGPNLKVSNLINGYPHAKYDLLLICDSDIRVSPHFLQSVTAHFSDPDVGLVTSPYRSSQPEGVAPALEALGQTAEMIPNVVTACRLEGLSFALGAAMTVRRSALEQIGGLPVLADFLADDYQLGNLLHKAGWRLVLDSQCVEIVQQQTEALDAVLARQLRWARTMRVSRPGGYLASGITLPGVAMIAALAVGSWSSALSAIALLYLLRLGVTTLFSRYYLVDNLLPRLGWLLPIRDLLATVIWLLAFLGNRVVWRGDRFRVLADGRLKRI